MFKVGDKVTRKGSTVWEIATAAPAGEEFSSLSDAMITTLYGSTDATVYRLKNITTGKISKNVLWTDKDLTAI